MEDFDEDGDVSNHEIRTYPIDDDNVSN